MSLNSHFTYVKRRVILYLIPVVGSGLWGPIWGYVALNSDNQTIYGVKFDP